MVIAGAQGRLVYFHRRKRGADVCAEGRSARPDRVEERVISAVKGLLLDPATVEAAVSEHQARRGERSRKARSERVALENERVISRFWWTVTSVRWWRTKVSNRWVRGQDLNL